MGSLIVASLAFVGTHFLLSHPLRASTVKAVGARGFLGLYSLVAFVTLGWMVLAYRAVPEQTPLWPAGDVLWGAATATMLIGSVLLAGSLVGNPAMPDPAGGDRDVPGARGVYAITRHPMMWGFALWALVHAAVYPVAANIVLTAAILILALGGAAAQDAKKTRLQPGFWPEWKRRTSYLPFAAIIARRARMRDAWPGAGVLLAGTVLWAAASWAHAPLGGGRAGMFRWLG